MPPALFIAFFATLQASQTTPVFLTAGENTTINAQDWNIKDAPVKWYRLNALPLDYNNVETCGLKSPKCVAPIRYQWEELPAIENKHLLHTKDYPEIFTTGTHRIRPSLAPLKEVASTQHTREVVIRRDNSYVGYVTELIGTPFVFLPKKTKQGHQTDLRLGADCVATLIYGQRRLGLRIPYVGPGGLDHFTQVVPRKDNQQPIAQGDLLHFGGQTAVVSKDLPPVGLLNNEDLIIHSYHQLVEEIPLFKATYARAPFEVRRWNPSK
jgi:hypothetical protein